MRLSKVVAMFMCEMVGWFVMRASQRGQPHARSLARHLDSTSPPPARKSCANRSRQRNPLPLASTDITTTTTRPQQHHGSTAISTKNTILSEPPLLNNPCALEGKFPPPPCRNSSDRYIPNLQPHNIQASNAPISADPPRLLTRMAPRRRRH